jgi:hypothetical protein
MASARATEQVYGEKAELLWTCLTGFRLLAPEGRGCAEKLLRFGAGGEGGFRFSYPESWRLRRRTLDDDEGEIILDNMYGDALAGHIVFRVSGRERKRVESHKAILLKGYCGRLEEAHVTVSGAPVLQVPATAPLKAALLSNLTGRFGQTGMDLPVILLGHPKASILLGLITPSWSASPEWWSINKRAFEIVRGSLLFPTQEQIGAEKDAALAAMAKTAEDEKQQRVELLKRRETARQGEEEERRRRQEENLITAQHREALRREEDAHKQATLQHQALLREQQKRRQCALQSALELEPLGSAGSAMAGSEPPTLFTDAGQLYALDIPAGDAVVDPAAPSLSRVELPPLPHFSD